MSYYIMKANEDARMIGAASTPDGSYTPIVYRTNGIEGKPYPVPYEQLNLIERNRYHSFLKNCQKSFKLHLLK